MREQYALPKCLNSTTSRVLHVLPTGACAIKCPTRSTLAQLDMNMALSMQ